MNPQPITALLPHGDGHQFVFYGDCCSGVPGMPNEKNFAKVNAALQRMHPPPEFIVFLGDHIAGNESDPDVLARHRVLAYLCSHIIAFDVKEHEGILQICSGGAGTNSRPAGFMGEGEYHHFVQAALDANELRLQTIDIHGSGRGPQRPRGPRTSANREDQPCY